MKEGEENEVEKEEEAKEETLSPIKEEESSKTDILPLKEVGESKEAENAPESQPAQSPLLGRGRGKLLIAAAAVLLIILIVCLLPKGGKDPQTVTSNEGEKSSKTRVESVESQADDTQTKSHSTTTN